MTDINTATAFFEVIKSDTFETGTIIELTFSSTTYNLVMQIQDLIDTSSGGDVNNGGLV